MRRLTLRVLGTITVVLGLAYLVWRWTASVRWDAWWLSVPLALAETTTLVGTALLVLTLWRTRRRPAPPAAATGTSVDVLVTTDDEPLEVVLRTVTAARDIAYPHRTWVLDDGARPELRSAAAQLGVEYVERSQDWADRPRHAKAGNLNNALLVTDGELVVVLEADQVPHPAILDRTLGYFADPRVALVQSPQRRGGPGGIDTAAGDPLDTRSPLVAGPVQEGKDGWGAAFVSGADSVLRRDALMQLGLVGYVQETERSVHEALTASRRLLENARRTATDPAQAAVLAEVEGAAGSALADLERGEAVSEVTFAFQREVDRISASVVAGDVARMQEDLRALGALPVARDEDLDAVVVDDAALTRLADRDWSPLGAVEAVQALVRAVDVGRAHEAQAVLPVPTTPVTEDVATAMHLHALGWRTVYHPEPLTTAQVPQDLSTAVVRRLRWAQGSMQALLAENPLALRGLRPGQRLMYAATGWAYVAGFAAVVLLAVPAVSLVTGVQPVVAWDTELLARALPYLLATEVLLVVTARGVRTWRGQQFSIAMFAVWVAGACSAAASVWWGRPTRDPGAGSRRPARILAPQLVAMVLLVLAAAVGVVRTATDDVSWTPTVVNLCWVAYHLVVLSVVLPGRRRRAARTARPKEA